VEDPEQRHHQREADRQADERREHDEDERLGPSGRNDRREAGLGHRRAGEPPISACDELVGRP
jgi:hypothetical protein